MTVSETAKALGVTRTQVWRLEHKSKTISAERLFEIADLYGVDPRKLFEGDNAPLNISAPLKRIEKTVALVEQHVQNLGSRPSPALVGRAVTAILRQEFDASFELTDQQFHPEKYNDLIKLIFTTENTK